MVIISIILFVIFTLVTIEDFKTRTLPLWLLILLGIFVIVNGIASNRPANLLLFFSINVLFTVAQFIIVTLYFSIRLRQPVNIINHYIGSGDIIFLLICCAAFAPLNFIVFQVLSFSLILFLYLIIGLIQKSQSKHIPLAGSLALAMNIFLVIQMAGLSLSSYDDSILLKYLF